MFCPGCGIERQEDTHACPCGYVPEEVVVQEEAYQAPPNGGGVTGAEIVNSLTSRFNINQLVIFGGCILLIIALFMPFHRIQFLGLVSESVSGFTLMRSLFGFLNLLLPLLAVAVVSVLSGLNIIKFSNPKLLILCLSLLGVYMILSILAHASVLGFGAGFGAVLSFILWIVVAVAAFMDYKGICLVKF